MQQIYDECRKKSINIVLKNTELCFLEDAVIIILEKLHTM